MPSFAGPYLAAVIVLGAAGVLKVLTPDAARVALRSGGLPGTALVARVLGVVEIAIAAAALVAGGRLPALAVAVAYAGFAGFSAVVIGRTRGQATCGCFGASDAPLTNLHVVVDGAVAALALAAVVGPVPDLVDAAGDTPWAGVPFVALVLLAAWLLVVALTVLPSVQAEAHRTAPPRPGTGVDPGPHPVGAPVRRVDR